MSSRENNAENSLGKVRVEQNTRNTNQFIRGVFRITTVSVFTGFVFPLASIMLPKLGLLSSIALLVICIAVSYALFSKISKQIFSSSTILWRDNGVEVHNRRLHDKTFDEDYEARYDEISKISFTTYFDMLTLQNSFPFVRVTLELKTKNIMQDGREMMFNNLCTSQLFSTNLPKAIKESKLTELIEKQGFRMVKNEKMDVEYSRSQ